MTSDLRLLVGHLNLVLSVDRTESALLRHMYHNFASIHEALHCLSVQFAPGLVDILELRQPPSLDRLMECTVANVGLCKSWVVYLLLLAHNDGIFVHAYCGSSVGARGAFKRTRICDVGINRQLVD
jgi:hypothetical protein